MTLQDRLQELVNQIGINSDDTKLISETLTAIKKDLENLIGEDEDTRWEDKKGEYIQDYEDACDKESRNELRAEIRTALNNYVRSSDE